MHLYQLHNPRNALWGSDLYNFIHTVHCGNQMTCHKTYQYILTHVCYEVPAYSYSPLQKSNDLPSPAITRIDTQDSATMTHVPSLGEDPLAQQASSFTLHLPPILTPPFHLHPLLVVFTCLLVACMSEWPLE